MPTCLYIRGTPGTGKRTVADILERDLGWPVLWVHHFDAVYKAIGEYRNSKLTTDMMMPAVLHVLNQKRDLIIVRPTRDPWIIKVIEAECKILKSRQFTFVPVRLTANYATLCTRITRRWHESPFRLTTKEALDEYLAARPESEFPGEHVIDTDKMTPEQVAGRIKELLPSNTPAKV